MEHFILLIPSGFRRSLLRLEGKGFQPSPSGTLIISIKTILKPIRERALGAVIFVGQYSYLTHRVSFNALVRRHTSLFNNRLEHLVGKEHHDFRINYKK